MKLLLFLVLLIGQNTYQFDEEQRGEASYYASKFEGRLTANGEVFSNDSLTAAHRSLPFGTYVKVTNLSNEKTIVVRINDRGPFIEGRIIDVTQKVARELDFYNQGITQVQLRVLKTDDTD